MTVWPDLPLTAAYFHIPFCKQKCTYCDFVSSSGRDETCQAAYIAALKNEIAASARYAAVRQNGAPHPLQTLYIGGGTPTILPTDALLDLIRYIRQTFVFADGYEWTMEANPGTVGAGQLRLLRREGINRLSFGFQAKQPHLLQILGRIHTDTDLYRSITMAQDVGFTNISVDLLTGLPQQTLDDVRDTVETVLRLPVTHVSYYSLILEAGTPLATACAAKQYVLPEDEVERSQYDLVREMLAAVGLKQYEISNSALPGYASRHNLTYWHALPYYGFGVAAHRYVDGLRSFNTDDLDAYLADWSSERQPDREIAGERIDRDEAMREMMLLGLRLNDGVRYTDFHSRFGCSLQHVFASELASLEKRGLIACDPEAVRLSRLGLDLANQVFLAFIR